MKKTIIPSLIAKSQKELNERFNKVRKHFNVFQLDVMDEKFVKSKSLVFDFKLPKNKKYEAHLMVSNPKDWIKKNHQKAHMIIFHVESTKNPLEIIKLIKSKKRKVGIALNPKTKVKEIIPYLNSINKVLIMTVESGKYGSSFQPLMLRKVRELRKLKPKLDIEVDGGMNEKTIGLAYRAGATSFISGSYLQNSKDVKKAKEKLTKTLK